MRSVNIVQKGHPLSKGKLAEQIHSENPGIVQTASGHNHEESLESQEDTQGRPKDKK